MKWIVLVGVLAAGYCYMLLNTADVVIDQTMQLHQTYQYVGEHADDIAGAPR